MMDPLYLTQQANELGNVLYGCKSNDHGECLLFQLSIIHYFLSYHTPFSR